MGALFGQGSSRLSDMAGVAGNFLSGKAAGLSANFLNGKAAENFFPEAESFESYMEQFMGGQSQSDKFLAELEQRGIDPTRFLADLDAEGIDPQKFLDDLNRGGSTPDNFLASLENGGRDDLKGLVFKGKEKIAAKAKAILNPQNKSNLSLPEVAEKAAALGGLDLKKFIESNDSVVSDILSKNRLSLKNEDIKDTPFSFMKGGATRPEELAALMDSAKADLPKTFKKQLGQSLLALGQENRAGSSMKVGADLMGAQNGAAILKDMLGTLGGELPLLKLDKEALPALEELMLESGLEQAEVNDMLADLAKGDMELDTLFHDLSRAVNDLEQKGSLVATKEGLAGLGQFFTDIGASPKVVESILGGFEPGEKITSAALKDLIGAADETLLNAPISEGNAETLVTALKVMGASPAQLNSLGNLLAESGGKMSVNDFAGFFDQMGPGRDVSVGTKELDLIKNILANINREQELAKTPVFNEILTKIQALGDQELDGEFTKLSPALQALRGGISAENAESSIDNADPDGQSERKGEQNPYNQSSQTGRDGQERSGQEHSGQRHSGQQYSGQERPDQQNSGQEREHEAREQYRQAAQAVLTGADVTASSLQTSETAQSYGYGGQDSVARQISQKILYSHNRGLHRLRMKLNPETLGGLDIELKVKDGELTAHIKAESRETYMALADEVDALKEALAEGGVKLSNMTLAFDDEETGRREFADLGMRGGRNPGFEEEEAIDPAIIHAAQMAAHDGLLSRII